MNRATSILVLLAAGLAAGCSHDRSAPLAEVEQRAVDRAATPAPVAQQPAPRSRPRPRPAPAAEPSPEVTLDPEPAMPVAREQPDDEPDAVPAAGTIAPPSYAAVAKIYNERIARLPRVWANSVVSADFTDDKGNQRYEQGNGHFQFQRPHSLALDIGKAGETLFWLGCDNDRFWVFDLQKQRTAHVGSLAKLTRERAAELGLPAIPSEFPMLMGIAPLPTDANASIRSINKGKAWRISLPPRNAIVTRLILDPQKVWPTRIEQLDLNGELLLESELAEYHQVKIAGEGGFFPQIPGRTRIVHPATNTTMIITLDDPVDDRQINPMNFDYAELKNRLGAQNEINIDDQPAPAPPAAAGN